MLTYADVLGGWRGHQERDAAVAASRDGYSVYLLYHSVNYCLLYYTSGTQFTCFVTQFTSFTGTQVRILTMQASRSGAARDDALQQRMLTYADVC